VRGITLGEGEDFSFGSGTRGGVGSTHSDYDGVHSHQNEAQDVAGWRRGQRLATSRDMNYGVTVMPSPVRSICIALSASVSLTRVKHLQLGNAIVGAAEPPAKLAVDVLHHHHIRMDVGLVTRVEVSGRELVEHGWALRDDGG
jgi:hypothetical protein